MSPPPSYHQPNAPDSPGDDSDSDIALDLDELDPAPATESSPAPRQSTDFHNRPIRLQKFRTGWGRRNRNKPVGTAQEEEDLRGLLTDHVSRPGHNADNASIDTTGEDDAPLLPTHNTRVRDRPTESGLAKLGTRLRLPSFKSNDPLAIGGQDEEDEPAIDHDPASNRTVAVGQVQTSKFPPNAISNAKYTPWSFLPRTLYNEFSFFLNLYFLLVALSQIIPALRIGYLSTYIAPLAFVVSITIGKEAYDDICRRRRDSEANSEPYEVLRFEDYGMADGTSKEKKRKMRKTRGREDASNLSRLSGENEDANSRPTCSVREITKASKDLKVGDIVKMGKDQRVPADMVLLKAYSGDGNQSVESTVSPSPAAVPLIDMDEQGLNRATTTPNVPRAIVEPNGEAFIRTDQLDGETDWKLRLTTPISQSLDIREYTRLRITAGKPDKRVNDFVGTLELTPKSSSEYDAVEGTSSLIQAVALTIDNTAWANTVLASNCTVLAVVVYTGAQTRQALSTSPSRSKTGLLENELNSLTKILALLTLTLSFLLVALQKFEPKDKHVWYISVMRFLILFSTIVPVSLRVNLDLGKSVYARLIEKDQGIPGTVVRTSTIPEDLGRIEYLLSDKTGTLTQNEMEMKKIHVGTVSYANEAMDEVSSYVRQGLVGPNTEQGVLVTPATVSTGPSTASTRARREISARVRDVVLALALCHNVTPTNEEEAGKTVTTYQASSPDEIAIVRWTEAVGVRLLQRDRQSMVLQSVDTGNVLVRVKILNVFPFTSEGKRMGIVVKFLEGTESDARDGGEIWFYQKGADTVMTSIVAANDWLDEETANMAREGLRTLVVGRKKLSQETFNDFATQYTQASISLQSREMAMSRVVSRFLESNLELLGVTGVEDKLQRDVKPSLELLRNAGIKIWMLTGDKVETARCVAVSSKLVARGQYVHTIAKLERKDAALDALEFLASKPDACLLIDGESLALMLTHFRTQFITAAVALPTVVACRCSPTQKADVAILIRAHTRKRVACIGDGGNDVSMIQAADVGVGIVGKEGRQASLAADFSITQFAHLTKLLVWHGRNSYKRSAKLSQFVMHRGLVVSVCQTLYSIASRFAPNALYRDWLLVGYATVYTMMPVFSLTLDRDVDESLATLYPELYKELTAGRSLSYKTFFVWVLISTYQGAMIQGLSQILVGVGASKISSVVDSDDGGNSGGGAVTQAQDLTFRRMVSLSFTVLIVNELVMVAAEITTWHPAMIFSILGTAALYFGSVPFLGEYYDLRFFVSVGFLWRALLVACVSLVPVYAAKIVGRTLRPPNYRKVRVLRCWVAWMRFNVERERERDVRPLEY
ncbi:phospholipid-translocating P-type ATPase-like protein [Pseudovirgaria hyperparasitica]|uniref:Phospholipid-transporting ATPase n=1 Tax=Pseudovirgaria hyperparasitica TaxID=470096 RepID=A0A6A6VYE6_9PEZI|nr:phospholipid-translocating P-type ATPase-like protein [Pseudovirgaria hyperparasitica]KAF2755652.1 phospholipid-translocating P-type ATPase-like protein [Pseudovirgaria hyperparasitica]